MTTKRKKPRRKRPDAILPEPRTPLGQWMKAKYGVKDYPYRLRVATGKVHSPRRFEKLKTEVPAELLGELKPYTTPTAL